MDLLFRTKEHKQAGAELCQAQAQKGLPAGARINEFEFQMCFAGKHLNLKVVILL
jgi:hypothetical protein